MARVTVEDCIDKIPNRFDLVLMASHRARNIASGAALTIERDNDKNPVVALRELADETLELGELREGLITSLQRVILDDDNPEDREDDKPVLALEHGETTGRKEMSPDDLVKALQGDRDNDSTNRF